MSVIVSHASALWYWRHSPYGIDGMRPVEYQMDNTSIPTVKELVNSGASTIDFGPSPLHVLVGQKANRRHHADAVPHVCSEILPARSFYQVDSSTLVCSPELCLLQMTRGLDLVEAIVLAYEFAGLYSLDPMSTSGFASRVSPLTTAERLRTYAGQLSGIYDSDGFKRAVRWTVDNSRSPMETALAMALSLPYRLGGSGIPNLRLNQRIDLSDEHARSFGAPYCVPDVFLEAAGLCIEYDSNLYHLDRQQKNHDDLKRNILAGMGYKVLTVNPTQLKSPVQLETLINDIQKNLHNRSHIRIPDYQKRRSHLLQYVLGTHKLHY